MKVINLEVGGVYRVGRHKELLVFLGSCGASNVVYFKDVRGNSRYQKTSFRNHKEAVGFYTGKFREIECEKIFNILK